MPQIVSSSLIPSSADTPLDSRCVVSTLAGIMAIENPYVGLHVYCKADGNYYKVTAIRGTTSGSLTVYTVDTYVKCSANGTNGTNGVTPHIDQTTGHWFLGTTDTGVSAQGPAGSTGSQGPAGTNGTNGTNGVSPHIDAATGHWFIGTTDTGVNAAAPVVSIDASTKKWKINGTDTGVLAQGTPGTSYTIGANNNWFAGTTDTGILARGVNGTNGTNGTDGADGEDGEDGEDGVRGSRWNFGTAITGTSTTPAAFPTGITDSLAGDGYLNTELHSVYECTTGGNAATALWRYAGTFHITVDSALSTTSSNPVRNSIVTAALNAKADALPVPEAATTAMTQSVTANRIYSWTPAVPSGTPQASAGCTLSFDSTGLAGKEAYCIAYITLGTYTDDTSATRNVTVTLGTGFNQTAGRNDDLTAGKTNKCVICWHGTDATLRVADKW